MKKLLAAISVALCFSGPSSAALINLDTLVGWDIQDQFGTVPFLYTNTYTTSVGTNVKVTDLYYSGDEYRYYINGNAIATILDPGMGNFFEANADDAFASGHFANAMFWLGAGETLSFEAITLPVGFGDGTIAVSAVSASNVPEPASLALLGLGLAGLSAMRRQKK